jgi:polar amino acid transport system ATP-binding protein
MLLPYQAIALDEPSASLDPVATAQVANTLTHLKKNNKAIIVTTHDIEFAKQIADKVFFINQGQMAEVGEKDILFQSKTKQLKLFLNTGEIT